MNTIKLIALGISILFWSGCATGDPASAEPRTNSGTQKDTAAHQHHESDDEVVYACPMHPEVTGKEGDSCPKCGMDLEKVE